MATSAAWAEAVAVAEAWQLGSFRVVVLALICSWQK